MRRLTPKFLLIASLLLLDLVLVSFILANNKLLVLGSFGKNIALNKDAGQAEASVKKVRRVKKIPTLAPKITPKATPTLTLTKAPTPTPTPSPTSVPTTPAPTQAQVQAPSVQSSNDPVKDYIMKAINEYRASNGLYGVQTNNETCSFAKTRAQEITGGFNHDGFTNRINSHTLPYSGYSSVDENIAMTSDYKQVVQMWINSPGHAENMRRDTPYVCVEQSGNYYAYEGWKP